MFTYSPAFRDMSIIEMYGTQHLAVDLKTIRRKTSEPRKSIVQVLKKNELSFYKFHQKCSKRNSLTDCENSQNSSQSSSSFSLNAGKQMTYWSIQRSKQNKIIDS